MQGDLHTINLLVEADTEFSENRVDCADELGDDSINGTAKFVQVSNRGSGEDSILAVRINDKEYSTFYLVAGESQVFNPGDITCKSVSFFNFSSGTPAIAVSVMIS